MVLVLPLPDVPLALPVVPVPAVPVPLRPAAVPVPMLPGVAMLPVSFGAPGDMLAPARLVLSAAAALVGRTSLRLPQAASDSVNVPVIQKLRVI